MPFLIAAPFRLKQLTLHFTCRFAAMVGQWTVEKVYISIMEAIKADLVPESSMIRRFFGMPYSGSIVTVANGISVFGVWEAMWARGLLTKHALTTAILDNNIENFFWDGVRKLAAIDHSYARHLMRMLVGATYGRVQTNPCIAFEKLPRLGPEPPRDVLKDLNVYLLDAMDTYCESIFQTEETQKAAWDRVDELVQIAAFLPHQSGLLEALVEAQEGYDETREIYGMTRTAPVCLKARIAALRML
jgi:hypothetical protein